MFALWLIFSPLILGYTDSPRAVLNAVIVGVIVLAMATYRMARPAGSRWPSWVVLELSAWLLISPFALGITSVPAAMWNDIAIALSLIVFTLVGLMQAYAPDNL